MKDFFLTKEDVRKTVLYLFTTIRGWIYLLVFILFSSYWITPAFPIDNVIVFFLISIFFLASLYALLRLTKITVLEVEEREQYEKSFDEYIEKRDFEYPQDKNSDQL